VVALAPPAGVLETEVVDRVETEVVPTVKTADVVAFPAGKLCGTLGAMGVAEAGAAGVLLLAAGTGAAGTETEMETVLEMAGPGAEGTGAEVSTTTEVDVGSGF
jgi:hypothetical protein